MYLLCYFAGNTSPLYFQLYHKLFRSGKTVIHTHHHLPYEILGVNLATFRKSGQHFALDGSN